MIQVDYLAVLRPMSMIVIARWRWKNAAAVAGNLGHLAVDPGDVVAPVAGGAGGGDLLSR